MDLDVLLSYLYDAGKAGPEVANAISKFALGYGPKTVAPVEAGKDFLASFGPSQAEGTPDDALRQAMARRSIGQRESQEQQAQLEQKQQAAQQMEQQAQEESQKKTAQQEYLRDYVSNMDQDKVARIRAQAAAMAGRPGEASPGGGGFTVAPDSPEIRQRLAERDAFVADQPMRDAQWERDLARQKGDQAGQNAAAEQLMGAKEQALIGKRQQMQQAIIDRLGDGTGKIPFDVAIQADASGINIPYAARGSNPDDVRSEIQEIISGANQDVQRIASNPALAYSEEAAPIIAFSRYAEAQAKRILAAMDAGQLSPDEAKRLITQLIQTNAQQSGAIDAAMALGMTQAPQQPQQGE